MPLGIISNEELESELGNSSTNKTETIVKDMVPVGRKPDVENIPEGIKEFIAEERLNGSTVKELQSILNISQPTISGASAGRNSADVKSGINKNLVNHINNIKTKISAKTSKKINTILDSVDDEAISELSVRERIAGAKDLSVIMRNMEPASASAQDKGNTNNVQFNFFVPQIKQESDYELSVVDQDGTR